MSANLWIKFAELGDSMEKNLEEAKQFINNVDKDFQYAIDALIRAHADLDNMILTAFQINKEK